MRKIATVGVESAIAMTGIAVALWGHASLAIALAILFVGVACIAIGLEYAMGKKRRRATAELNLDDAPTEDTVHVESRDQRGGITAYTVNLGKKEGDDGEKR